MRRSAILILGLLLLATPLPAGTGHLHAASEVHGGGLHLDHVHPHAHAGSGPGAQHPPAGRDHELALDHGGEDAISVTWTGSPVSSPRLQPGLNPTALRPPAPSSVRGSSRRGQRLRLREPDVIGRPPGRAPPA